jgi:hypothetical protein
MHTLEDTLLAEQARCRQLAREYTELGTAAASARAPIEDSPAQRRGGPAKQALIAMQRARAAAALPNLNHLAIQVSHGARSARCRHAAARTGAAAGAVLHLEPGGLS